MAQEVKAVDKDKVIEYVKIINKKITDEDDDLLGFVTDEIIDRLYAYLNRNTIPTKLSVERMLAKIVSGIFTKYKVEVEATEPDKAITSITDANGQSVSYSENIISYLTTASDNEVFTGVTDVLAIYRRVNVIL